MILLLALSSAHAAECGVVSPADLDGRLDMFDTLFAKGRTEALTSIVEETEAMFPCANGLVKPAQVARFAHDMAIVRYFQQDEEEAIRWAHAADAAVPKYPWPGMIGPTHPLREMVASSRKPGTESAADGKTLAPPKGAAVFVNGRFIDAPTAAADVPVLVQVFTSQGRQDGWWQDGGSFPDAVLAFNTTVKRPGWVPDAEADTVALAAARERYGDASAEGVANVNVCAPMDGAAFRQGVSRAGSALDNDDLAAFDDEYRSLKVNVACLTEPVPRDTWARFLVDLAVVEYATGQLWPEPLGTALAIDPDVDRSATPAELQSYLAPPGAPPSTTKLPADAAFYVDGAQVYTVPDLAGVHIVQRLKGGRWDGRLVRNETFPKDWTTVAPTTTGPAAGEDTGLPPIVIGVVGGLGLVSQDSGIDGVALNVPTLAGSTYAARAVSTGHVAIAGPVAVFWDGALGLGGDVAEGEDTFEGGLGGDLYAGVGFGGSVVVDVGGGISTAAVDDKGVRRTFKLPQARVGVGATVPLGGLGLDLGAAGGGSTSGYHVRVRAGLFDASDATVSWYGGLELANDVAWFVQDGVDRDITANTLSAGLRVGARL